MPTPLKRQIGYVRPEQRSKITPEITDNVDKATIAVLKTEKILSDVKDKPQKIVNWIKTHPEFKWSAMCKKLGIDKGNFQRSLKTTPPNIKEEYISKIESFLKNYGY